MSKKYDIDTSRILLDEEVVSVPPDTTYDDLNGLERWYIDTQGFLLQYKLDL